jgi:hypothetical protein
MRAILINAENETISEVEYDGDYRSIYKLIGCETFTIVQFPDGETLYVEDNGLLFDPQHFFKHEGYHQPLAGNGLFLGSDDEGESIATQLSIDKLKDQISFAHV